MAGSHLRTFAHASLLPGLLFPPLANSCPSFRSQVRALPPSYTLRQNKKSWFLSLIFYFSCIALPSTCDYCMHLLVQACSVSHPGAIQETATVLFALLSPQGLVRHLLASGYARRVAGGLNRQVGGSPVPGRTPGLGATLPVNEKAAFSPGPSVSGCRLQPPT